MLQISGDIRIRANFRSYWDAVARHVPPSPILDAIRASGLHGVYQIGAFRHDAGLLTAFLDRWRPETHTFHFRFGEATITLEDVHHILGLPTSGSPVIHSVGSNNLDDRRQMVTEVLGLRPPDSCCDKGGIFISWLVREFASCHRLDVDGVDYEQELVYHIRAHLLMIIGSLFPNSSGNKIRHPLLHYVRDHTEVSTYSWGSAVLAYLYRRMCDAAIGDTRLLCGAVTLLQVLFLDFIIHALSTCLYFGLFMIWIEHDIL